LDFAIKLHTLFERKILNQHTKKVVIHETKGESWSVYDQIKDFD